MSNTAFKIKPVFKGHLNLLAEGTQHPETARNWHMQGVINNALNQILYLKQLSAFAREQKDLYQQFNEELSQWRAVYDNFLKQWPRPKTTYITDIAGQIDTDTAKRATITSNRPLKPLIYVNSDDARFHSRIIYLDPDTKEAFSVPNLHYNQPNKAVIIEFSY